MANWDEAPQPGYCDLPLGPEWKRKWQTRRHFGERGSRNRSRVTGIIAQKKHRHIRSLVLTYDRVSIGDITPTGFPSTAVNGILTQKQDNTLSNWKNDFFLLHLLMPKQAELRLNLATPPPTPSPLGLIVATAYTSRPLCLCRDGICMRVRQDYPRRSPC